MHARSHQASPVFAAAPHSAAGFVVLEPSAELVAELRRIAETERGLLPLFRGLPLAANLAEADLALLAPMVTAAGARVLEEAEALLRLFEGDELPLELEDLGALAAVEIRAQCRRFRPALAAKGLPLWELGSLAQALVSKTLKAAIAAENACSDLLGCEPSLSLMAETLDGLAVRQAYCKLWSSLDSSPAAATDSAVPAGVEAGLHSGSAAIAELIGREIFLDLRYHDRQLILSMQRRIRSWQQSGGESEDGEALLQDLASLFQLLSQVNNRIELLLHDQALVKALLVRLRAPSPEPPLRDLSLRRSMLALLGRDSELDQVLLGNCWDTPASELLRLLGAIGAQWNLSSKSSIGAFEL